MRFESIEWLRQVMKGYTEFSCRCGKEFTDFDLWWNHMFISGHIPLTEDDIQMIKRYVEKLAA